MSPHQQPANRRAAPAGRPCRRFTDVIEDVAAWVLASTGAFLLVAAILVGFAVHAGVVDRSGVARATLTPVDAVLLEDAPVVRGVEGSAVVRAEAAWTGPDGLAHEGAVPVASPAQAGSTVPVWIDRDGRPAREPVGDTEAVFAGVVAGVGLLLMVGSVLSVCWMGVRRVTGRVNAARWEREWERFGPEWSREA